MSWPRSDPFLASDSVARQRLSHRARCVAVARCALNACWRPQPSRGAPRRHVSRRWCSSRAHLLSSCRKRHLLSTATSSARVVRAAADARSFLGCIPLRHFFFPDPSCREWVGLCVHIPMVAGMRPDTPTEHRDRHRAEHSGTDADSSARAASLRQVRGLRSPYTTYCDRN